MTITQIRHNTIAALKKVSDEPMLETDLLLSSALGVEKPKLASIAHQYIPNKQQKQFQSLVDQRLLHKPLSYILGQKEFYKRQFFVNKQVLIPRPETEILIDLILNWSKQQAATDRPSVIADIGTGAGVIAITLAKLLPFSTLLATDISLPALAIAKKNAQLHHIDDHVTFLPGSLLAPITDQPVDILVANLPYIPTERIKNLAPEVRDYEPRLALDGGQDGFDYYRKLLQQIASQNYQPKLICFEIDYSQKKLAQRLSKQYLPMSVTKVKKDYYGKYRVVVIEQNAY